MKGTPTGRWLMALGVAGGLAAAAPIRAAPPTVLERAELLLLQDAALGGDVAAQRQVAGRFAQGTGGADLDPVEALKYWAMAARADDPESICRLAQAVHLGRGVGQNDEKAAGLWRKAADLGHAEAQSSLGWCFAHGRGVATNFPLAVHWFRRAAEQGYADAQYFLAWHLENGVGTATNAADALTWYRRAAEQGQPDAQNNLGILLAEGNLVPRDPVEAYFWLRLATVQGAAGAAENAAAVGKTLGFLQRRGVESRVNRLIRAVRNAER